MTTNTNYNLDLSLVIPLHNEAENLDALVKEILEVLNQSGLHYEVILVNDGSADPSAEILNRLAGKSPLIRPIHLKKRAGQTAALVAGFNAAEAPLISMMDADLQYDPRDILPLIRFLQENNLDLVCGWRRRRADSLNRRLASIIANAVRNRFTHDGIHDTGCTLKIFRKGCLAKIKFFDGMHRFLPVLFQMEGFRVGEMRVNHRPRLKGKTKYTILNRLLGSLYDLWAVQWMKCRHLHNKLRDGSQ
ncbi:MAG: glycosyltransferase family 2 protein [Candidatus Omnitrophica bacterium]|nr:glycosyltransferase family 2 protein [Candidatus Omnitrophota bacterium]